MPKTTVARGLMLVSVVTGLVFRLWVAATDHGIFWPDEMYQSFEPAHRAVFGHGLVPWEFKEGARNWALPGLVAILLKLLAVIGLDRPAIYIPAIKGFFGLASVAAGLGVYRLVRVLTVGLDDARSELAAAIGCAAWLWAPVSLYFASRAMSENASAAVCIWGFALACDAAASRRAFIIGVSLLALGVLFRLQTAVFPVALLAFLTVGWRRSVDADRPRRLTQLRDAVIVLSIGALAFGALDAATWSNAPGAKWGGWFHSAVVYVRFNWVENRGAQWGTAPWQFYFDVLWRSMPLVMLVWGVSLLAIRRALVVWVAMALFFAMHLAVGHKEIRFLLPVLPMICAAAGVGLTLISWMQIANAAAWVSIAMLAISGSNVRQLTMRQLGAYVDRPLQTSAWNDFAPVNRLMLKASELSDLCGLRVDVHLAWTGGSTYVHRNAPLYMAGAPTTSKFYNYAIVGGGGGLEVIAEDSGLALVRVPGVSTCEPNAAYTWALP